MNAELAGQRLANSRVRWMEGGARETYDRLDELIGTYHFLDLAPKGRDEDNLKFTMSWVRHHDKYEDGQVADPQATYVPPKVLEPKCCHD